MFLSDPKVALVVIAGRNMCLDVKVVVEGTECTEAEDAKRTVVGVGLTGMEER